MRLGREGSQRAGSQSARGVPLALSHARGGVARRHALRLRMRGEGGPLGSRYGVRGLRPGEWMHAEGRGVAGSQAQSAHALRGSGSGDRRGGRIGAGSRRGGGWQGVAGSRTRSHALALPEGREGGARGALSQGLAGVRGEGGARGAGVKPGEWQGLAGGGAGVRGEGLAGARVRGPLGGPRGAGKSDIEDISTRANRTSRAGQIGHSVHWGRFDAASRTTTAHSPAKSKKS